MRIKRMGVSWDLMKSVLAQDNVIPATKVTSDGLPADSVVCGVHLQGGTIWLDVQSETFEHAQEGNEIPILSPAFLTLPARTTRAGRNRKGNHAVQPSEP